MKESNLISLIKAQKEYIAIVDKAMDAWMQCISQEDDDKIRDLMNKIDELSKNIHHESN